MEERKNLLSLKPLLRRLSEKDLEGYAEADCYGNLVITIPGAAMVLERWLLETEV